MQSFSTAKHQQHCKFPVVITSNVAAVSDSKVIVDASERRIEPDGAYSQD